MDLTLIPLNLISDWIDTLLVTTNSDRTNFAVLMQMNDAQKIASLTSYLQTRILDDQTEISNLSASLQSSQDSLNSDIAACQNALTQISGK